MSIEWDKIETQLSEEQRRIYDLSLSERVLLKGPAGTGKTTLAVLRAVDCCIAPRDLSQPKVLILTYNKNLIDRFIQTGINELSKKKSIDVDVTAMTLDAYARRLLEQSEKKKLPYVKDEETFQEALRETLQKDAVRNRCSELNINPDFINYELAKPFYKEEFMWISGNLIQKKTMKEDYLKCERVGRSPRATFGPKSYIIRTTHERKLIWTIYTTYYRLLGSQVKTFEQLRLMVAHGLPKPDPKYTHVIVDEAQDFSPLMMKIALMELDLKRPEAGLTILASDRQKIYQGSVSWKKHLAEFCTDYKTYHLHKNFRNPPDIAFLADDFYRRATTDPNDDEQGEQKPVPSFMKNISWIHGESEERAKNYLEGMNLGEKDTSVLFRNKTRAKSTPLSFGFDCRASWREFKGGENKIVVLYDLTEENLKGGTLKESEPEEYLKNCKLLYTLMTRASEKLIFVSWGTPSPLLESALLPFTSSIHKVLV